MKFQCVGRAYKTADNKCRLYEKTLDTGGRLDVTVQSLIPGVGYLPPAAGKAFESVILWVSCSREDTVLTPAVWAALYKGTDIENAWAVLLGVAKSRVICKFPELKDDPRTAYVCPVIAGSGAGYQHGYVVATDKSDAHTFAEYLAGGRVEIFLNLYSAVGGWLGGELLGDVSYSDALSNSDTYRRIIEGERFAEAAAGHITAGVPEPQNPEYPVAELLKTFKKIGKQS
jgi:hypothetical protein